MGAGAWAWRPVGGGAGACTEFAARLAAGAAAAAAVAARQLRHWRDFAPKLMSRRRRVAGAAKLVSASQSAGARIVRAPLMIGGGRRVETRRPRAETKAPPFARQFGKQSDGCGRRETMIMIKQLLCRCGSLSAPRSACRHGAAAGAQRANKVTL